MVPSQISHGVFKAAAIALLLLFVASPARAEGLLSRARSEVNEPERLPDPSPPASSDSCDSGKSKGGHSHDHDDTFDDLYVHLCFYGLYGLGAALTSPWWGPHAMVDEGLSIPNYFPSHPYYVEDAGYMLTSTSNWADEVPYDSATRVSLEYGTDLDDLQSVTGRVLWEHRSRFGVDGEIRYLQEDGRFADDQLAIGDLNVVYRFAQSERLVMRSGLGINWMIDEDAGETGFNFTYGGDLFPCDPLVISSEIDWGTLGDASIFHWRTTVGAVFDHVEVYAGYQIYNVEGVGLDGVILGLRTWF